MQLGKIELQSKSPLSRIATEQKMSLIHDETVHIAIGAILCEYQVPTEQIAKLQNRLTKLFKEIQNANQ